MLVLVKANILVVGLGDRSDALKALPIRVCVIHTGFEAGRSLKNENVGYVVAKKSLFKRVLNNANIKGNALILSGELALAFGEDLITPARSIYDFQKKLDGKVSIIGGVFDGEYKSQEEMLGIASIPSLQVLRGMFVNIINSPIRRLAIALNAIANK